jgi:predicted PurR-regulated permease PerM
MDMNPPNNSQDTYRKGFILVLVVFLLIIFFLMIRDLIVTICLSASLTSLLYPFREQMSKALKGRRTIASVIILVLSLLIIGIPLLIILTIAAREAIQISESVMPWLKQQMNKPVDQWAAYFEKLPFYQELVGYQVNFMEGFTKLLQTIGSHFAQIVTTTTSGTIEFFFKTFVAIYSAFFFLNDGDRIYKSVSGYFPLSKEEAKDMGDRMVVIVRSTIKSLFVIGAVQGFLLTVAFWFFGIKAPIFWGILCGVLSAIPGLGAPIVWVPAVIYLVCADRLGSAVGLALWGVLVIGLADNFLRPIIVGQDSKIHELLIFFAMIGGLTIFGLAGLILGPVLIGLLLSVLHIYKKAFRRLLEAGVDQ